MIAAATQTHLDRIVARTRADLPARKTPERTRQLGAMAARHVPRGFAAALRHVGQARPAIIAELKKASPSKGLIRPVFEPAELARSLQHGGAACLSVLTDEPFFQGSLRNLELASQASSLPCLRKDFMVDPFQVLEARAHGADAILLIVAALTDAELQHLRASAREHGLDVLCEVHNREELERALLLDCEMIGIKSRDLRTFAVDTAAAAELAQHLPANVVRVAESGIHTPSDIQRMTTAGFNAFLVGESLMREVDPGERLRALLQLADPAGRGEVVASVHVVR